jgi:hypothetical protein
VGAGESIAVSAQNVVTGAAAPSLSLGPDGQWTWYDAVPGMKCLDGSPTGFAVNPQRNGNGKVLVFLDGGGLCLDAASCNGPVKTVNHTSYGASDFAAEMTAASSANETTNQVLFGSYTWSKTQGARGIWDRTAAANPFRDYSFVFLPYCTGDLFMGARHDTSSSFRTPSNDWFVGNTNVNIYTQAVLGLFPEPAGIALVGFSAGGLGTLYAYPRLKSLYPTVPMSVLGDAGAPFWTGDELFSPRQGYIMMNFLPPGIPSYEEDWWADAWGLDATHPPGVAAVTRIGAQRSMYPMQSVLIANATGSSDTFGVLEASNDALVPYFWHLSVNGLAHPNVNDAEIDFSAHVTNPNVHALWVSNPNAPNPSLRAWNTHHGFLTDDVSVWTQSGVLPWLTNNFAL